MTPASAAAPRRNGSATGAARPVAPEPCLRRRSPRSSWASFSALGRFPGSTAVARATARSTDSGRSGRNCSSGGGPPLMLRAVSCIDPFQKGCWPASASQEQDADGPDVGRRARLVAGEALRRDVGERAGNVADRGQRLRLREQGETEVEQSHRDRVALREQDVRRLDVAVHDPAGVRIGERVAQLRCSLDRLLVAQPAGAHRLAQRQAGDVLVRDVDVTCVPRQRERAQAVLVAQAGRCAGLALRPSCRLALSGDDLQGKLVAVSLVANEPDRAGATAAQRAERTVSTEDQVIGDDCIGRARHRPRWVGRGGRKSFSSRATG